jgi:hypothetical protein
LGTGGGGNGPPGGAGRIGIAVLKVAALALDGPFATLWSEPLRVVTLGTELVVDTRGGSPGCAAAPVERPRLTDPFFVGE